MYIGQFIKEMETTRETIRYYIDEQLLLPQKENGNYLFTEREKNDFENVRELRQMGLPIRVIKRIQHNKKDCGTKKQWEANLTIITDELQQVESDIEKLSEQRDRLNEVKLLLEEVI